MIFEAIKNFHRQFEYTPEIINPESLKPAAKFIIAGIGGSNLVADLLRLREPYCDIIVHKNYGLPKISEKELKERLVIANSYSGNTEETIDSLSQALAQHLPVAVIATGGRLIELAKEHHLPYIQMPVTGIQPRSALGFNIKAVVKLMGQDTWLEELTQLTTALNPAASEASGKSLAEKLTGFVPIIYSSAENIGIVYNWKIKLNETGKIPAFYNVLPELNHNEMTGFDVKNSTQALAQKFYFILLKDLNDHPRTLKRLEVLEKLYRDRHLPTESLTLVGDSVFEKIFNSLILADWTAYYLASQYDLEAEQVPMVEEFKKLILA